MAGNTVTLAVGAAVALLAIFNVLRPRAREDNEGGTLFAMLAKVALTIGLAGWLTMWFTEEAIWSPATRRCEAFASIELKGHVYRTCSYLVHRYETGEWMFWGALLTVAVCIGLSKLDAREA